MITHHSDSSWGDSTHSPDKIASPGRDILADDEDVANSDDDDIQMIK